MGRAARHILFSAAAMVAVAGTAAAQGPPSGQPPEGPLIVGERKQVWKAIELGYFRAGLDFYGRFQKDTLKQSGLPKITDEEQLYREAVDLDAEAFIGHKNLLDLTARAKLGIEDRFIDSGTTQTNGHESDFTDLYDIEGLVLQNGPAPLTVYTRRDEALLDREFAPSIDSITTESGAILDIHSETAPTTLRYFHSDSSQDDPSGLSDYHLVQDSFSARNALILGENHRLETDYTYDHIKEDLSAGASDEYDRHDLLVNDLLYFGGPGKHELRSTFRFFDQGGNFDQQTVRLDENLLLRHTDRLESRYNLTAERTERGGLEQRVVRGSASVRHRLFESLVSTAAAGAEYLEIPGEFQSDDYFINGGVEYTKKVPLGQVEANANAGYDARHNGERGTTLPVLDDVFTFNDPFPVVIPRRNIVQGSITVTGVGGLPTYQEGLDYTVQYFPDRAELRRVVGGAIANGQSVQVDYDVGPEPAADIGTTTYRLGLRYTFTEGTLEGLSFYTTYSVVDHTLDTVDPSLFVLDDVNDLLYGAEYRVGWLTLRAERENRDSTVSPQDTTRLQALLDYRISPFSSVNAEFTHEIIDYSNPSYRVEFTRVLGRWNQRFGPELDLKVQLEYRDENNELFGDTQGFEQIVGFHWHKNQTTIYGNFRNSMLDASQSSTTSQLIEIGVRRSF